MAEQNTSGKNNLDRPVKDTRKPVNMRLPSKLLEKMRVEAAANDRSVTSIVVEMMRQRYQKSLDVG